MRLKELKNKTLISRRDDEINAVTPKRTENDRPRRDKGINQSCQYCREDTDEATAQHTDNRARNVAVITILPKFANKEIRTKSLRQRTS